MRRLIVIALLALTALALLPARHSRAQADARCFPETGYCISGPIRQYWERNGGLPVFGFPITALQTETVEGWTGPVQWFQRDRLEDHSGQGQGVLAGRLGVERLAQQGRPWQFRPLGQPPQPGCRGFSQTGYHMCGGFLTFWERNGGLERFGYPVTDQIVERLEGRDYTVQYFERRRMEFHPELGPNAVLLGLLGSEVRAGAGPVAQPTPAPPTPTPAPSQQITISEPGDNQVISSPVRISGSTARFPAGGVLRYRFYEPNGRELGRGNITVSGQQGQAGSFRSTVAYTAPAGERVLLELAEVDPNSGNVIARAERQVRYAPTTAQQLTIDAPASGSRVGRRIAVSGRAAIFPSEGDLTLNVIDGTGRYITNFIFGVGGTPGQSTSFFVEFEIPDQAGRLVTVEVLDVNSRGDVLARAQSNVFAGTPNPYPAP